MYSSKIRIRTEAENRHYYSLIVRTSYRRHIGTLTPRGGCLELYYCNGGLVLVGFKAQALSVRPTGFLRGFDTVGLVI